MLSYDNNTVGSSYSEPTMPFEGRLGQMKAQGVASFGDFPSPDAGPLFMFFDAFGTHPGAKDTEIFGGGAVLTQNGKVLGSFQGFALEQAKKAPDWWHERARNDKAYFDALECLPKVKDTLTLNIAFGDFRLWCWKVAWQCFELQLESVNGSRWFDMLTQQGFLHVVHNGLLEQVETSFFHRTYPERCVKKDAQLNDHVSTLVHPYHVQKLNSLLTGMGYRPSMADSEAYQLLGISSGFPNPLAHSQAMSTLFWAAKNRDSRLEAFRMKGW